MRVKKMVGSRLQTMCLSLLLLASFGASAAIDGRAMNAQGTKSAQMVNLNLQFKAKNKTVNSDLTMPFYQTAELEKKVGDKNVLVEINPRRGKHADEIALEMKFYKASGTRAFYKKEIIAKVNQDSRVSFRGMSVRVRPVLN